jgi:hypothetical protein
MPIINIFITGVPFFLIDSRKPGAGTCALSCTVNGGKIVPGADKLKKPGLIISLGAGNSALTLGNGGKLSNSLN